MLLDEASRLGADKVLLQKSGYSRRFAAPNVRDLDVIRRFAAVRAVSACDGVSGVAGIDEDQGVDMSVIAFSRIKRVLPQFCGVDAGKRPHIASKAEAEATPRVDVGEVSTTLVSRGGAPKQTSQFPGLCKSGWEDTGCSSLERHVHLRFACSGCLSSSCFT